MFLEVHSSENIDLNHQEMPQTCLRLATKMENKQNNPQQLNKAAAFLMKPEVKGRAQPLRNKHTQHGDHDSHFFCVGVLVSNRSIWCGS